MKKKLCLSLGLLFTFLMIVTKTITIASVPYNTMTIGPEGDLVWTQTAYVPIGIFNQDIALSGPEDLFIHRENFYVVDSLNKRIVILNKDGALLKTIGEDVLQGPTGIYVTDAGGIYVADPVAKQVFLFNHEGKLLYTYGRPEEPLFGRDNPFVPEKLVVDRRGNLSIIGEGALDGVIQLNYVGDFLGYYGMNLTPVSIQDQIADWFLGEENDLASKLPPAPSNITLDDRDLIYTVTENSGVQLKKLNIEGIDLYGGAIFNPLSRIRDLWVGGNYNLYAVTEDGTIVEYDNEGNLLFSFGGLDTGSSRLGLLTSPSAIAVDAYGNIYIADRTQNTIQVYQKTSFVEAIHAGIRSYDEGNYAASETTWTSVIQMNSSFALAHRQLGRTYFKQLRYDDALAEFRLANDRAGYSDAFWRIRHQWLQSYLGWSILLLIGVVILYKIIKMVHRRTGFLQPAIDRSRKIGAIKPIREVLLLFRMFKHPLDTFYEIKHRKASMASATFWLIVLFIEYLIYLYQRSFIFNYTDLDAVSFPLEFVKIIGVVLLFVFANYLVSTLGDGEGWFRDVYIGTIYSLAPIILALLPITLISNGLTMNESFIYSFMIQVFILWSIFLLFFMVKDIHNYEFGETIKNIFITLFTMVIIVLLIFIVYLLLTQLFDFIAEIISEVTTRATLT